ncbi:DUF1007 family protein [Sedimentitalea todarodis]|uniref:DUF1007 family protein n=1 Tax=Sedimentitalea todarodis TaxID=1631240 RepID=A0ABU3VF69_9RHOB|nr:DUF1007 family protein [Sedimentitalea todarodis]MDU9004832.1 DUF1007 family protein [Sedimentitalea todarodis]
MTRLLAILLCTVPVPALTHPHIFIDTGVDIILDESGALSHLKITWTYDEYYSLLITEELKIDQDFDGVLTEEDIARLTGFDMNWVPGFNGDLVALLDEALLDLSGPQQPTATLKDGRITTTHVRQVEATPSLAGHILSLRAYDETYYTAYDVTLPVKIKPASICTLDKIAPDIDGELEQMRQMLLTINADADLEENEIPLIGAKFATEIRVSCPAS